MMALSPSASGEGQPTHGPLLRLLLLEDSTEDARLLCAYLEELGLRHAVVRTASRSEFEALLRAERFDVVLSDFHVPGFSGAEALTLCRTLAPQTPFLFVSGALGEERAIDLLKQGATDYVLKDRLERLGPSLERALRESRERRALAKAQLERETWTRRLELLAAASEVLTSSLEWDETLENVIGLALPVLGDFGIFDVMETDGNVRRVARAHQDPRMQALLAQTHWVRSTRTDLNVCALSSGQAALHPEVDEAWMERVAEGPAHLELMRELGFCSMLTVPLPYRDRVLGALTLFFGASDRHHSADDLTLATELARRAATAVENARLYAAEVEARREIELLADELRRREEQSRTLVSTLAEGILLVDPQRRVVQANAAASQLLDRSEAELLGSSALDASWDTVREDGSPVDPRDEVLARTIEAQEAVVGEVLGIRRRDGRRLWLHVNAQPFQAGAGAIAGGAVVSFFDITARKQAEAEALRRAEFERELVGIVSHDLRNPVSAILLTAQVLLKHENLDERGHRSAARILTSAERAHRLIRDLLDFTQARLGGGIPVERRACDLQDVAAQALEEVASAHPERELRFEPSGETSGEWDPDRIAQIVTNLVSNAVSYGQLGSPIRIALEGLNGQVRLSVTNDGAPIPPEQLASLFQPFRRGKGAKGGGIGNIGLGLFIVEQLVRAHDGRIEVRSGEAEGTTFTVTLPRRARPPA